MEFSVKSGSPEKQRTACVVVGVFEPRRLSPIAEQLDHVSGGFLGNLLRRGDMEGKFGQVLLLHNVPNTLCDRVLLVGCGRERELGDQQYRKIIAKAIHTLNDTGSMEAVCFLTELNVKGRDIGWKVRHGVEASTEALYRFDKFKSKKDSARRPLRKLVYSVPTRRDLPGGEQAVQEGLAISNGINFCKDLANMPPNLCHPTYLAEEAQALAGRSENLKVTILDQAEMEKLRMGALLSVARGSRQPPKLIIMEYKGGEKSEKPIVIIGKGVTFDSGGISIKPSANMDEMKYDMCGAAAVFGTISALTNLKPQLNVVGIVAAVENMPDGNASRPGDIVTSMSGTTIEILNTDAEGRLILCDAITYAKKFNPSVVIDVATLTGACVVALGSQHCGLMSNHNPLAHDLGNAGRSSTDLAWRLPLTEEYAEQLHSNFADLSNIGGREAGTITAGCFLQHFAKRYQWAHLDIAGVAWKSGKEKGASGRPVPLLTQYIIDRWHEKLAEAK